ncbi:MAG: hypothetical protein WBF52_21690 [Geitlerinemataceae cyanobacterium]
MQKAKPLTSTLNLREARKRSHWLDTTELVSVVGSGLGLVVSVISEQAIAVAFPLTLAVSLNILNRKRFQHQFQHEHRAAIAQVYDIIKSLPDPDNISALTEQILRLEQSNQVMTAQIEALKQQVRVKFKPEQLEILKEAIALLRSDLTEIQHQAIQRQELENHLQMQLKQLYDRFEILSPIQQPEEVRRIENAIAILHRDLSALKAQVAPVASEDWQRVGERVIQLQTHLQAVDRAIVPMRRQQQAVTHKLLPRIVQLINELRHSTHAAPVQKTIVHRPPSPRLHHSVSRERLPQSPTSGNSQPLHHQQPQRERL